MLASVAALALVAFAEEVRPSARPPLSIASETIDGSVWWSVEARNVPVQRVLAAIVDESGLTLELPADERTAALVTTTMTRRPLEQVLRYVLGSVGLRADVRRGAITVLAEPAGADPEQLLVAAAASWMGVTSRFPGHPEAPTALLAQGELAELRGLQTAARDHYRGLLETYPLAHEAGEALMRTGRILKRQQNWSEASLHFRELANRSEHGEYMAPARLELARCSIELGNPENARYVLNALDADYPSDDPVEVSERLLVRARALAVLGLPMDALAALDRAEDSLDPLARRDALEIRARALEDVGLLAEASRAWLLAAQRGEPAARARAYEAAARLALESGDELGTLFVCKEARQAGLDQGLAVPWKEARRRLGFDDPTAAGVLDVEERLARTLAWLDEGLVEEAIDDLQSVYLARGALEEQLGARVTVAWARCIDARDGLAEAIQVLREARPAFTSIEARGRIDVGAARLYEEHSLFELAVDAYEGRLTDPPPGTGRVAESREGGQAP